MSTRLTRVNMPWSAHISVRHTFIDPKRWAIDCSYAMTMMCGGVGLLIARRIDPVEPHLGVLPLVPPPTTSSPWGCKAGPLERAVLDLVCGGGARGIGVLD